MFKHSFKSLKEYLGYDIRENEKNFTQISEELGFSSIHYFSRLFKKKTGMRPIGWLNRYRLDQAQRLLSETDMKIKEIAEAAVYIAPAADVEVSVKAAVFQRAFHHGTHGAVQTCFCPGEEQFFVSFTTLWTYSSISRRLVPGLTLSRSSFRVFATR